MNSGAMAEKWLVIGISGVTCGGKTTLANKLNEIFTSSKLFSQDDYFLPDDDARHTWIPKLNHVNYDILSSLDMEKMHLDLKEFFKDKILYEVKNSKRSDTVDLNNLDVNNYKENSTNDEITQSETTKLKTSSNMKEILLNNSSRITNEYLETKTICLLNKLRMNVCIIEGFCIFNYSPVETYCQMKYFLELDYTECQQRRCLRVYDPPDTEGYFEECAWPEYQKHLDEVKSRVESVVYLDGTKTNSLHKVLTDVIDFLT